MKVIYEDGTEGVLSDKESTEFYIRNRLTKEKWQELFDKMKEMKINSFEDEFAKQFGIEMISISYVRNQITHLSY